MKGWAGFRNLSCEAPAAPAEAQPELDMDDMMVDEEAMMGGRPMRNTRKPSQFEHVLIPVEQFTLHKDIIKGFRFEFAQPLSPIFMLTHSWFMPNSEKNSDRNQMGNNPMMAMMMGKEPKRPGYQLSAQYVSVKNGEQVPKFIAMARMYSSGTLEANLIKPLSAGTMLKFQSNFQTPDPNMSMNVLELTNEGKDYVGTVRCSSQFIGGNYMQSLWRGSQFGFDYMYMVSPFILELE